MNLRPSLVTSLEVRLDGLPEDLLHPPEQFPAVRLQLRLLVLHHLTEEGHRVRKHGEVALAAGLHEPADEAKDAATDLAKI